LGSLLLSQDRSEELRADYEDILATLGQPVMGFICQGCRQKLPEHLFRCPSCESWDVVRREQGPQGPLFDRAPGAA
jgi:lipopolysaccharide biosynthesis regulator YciM